MSTTVGEPRPGRLRRFVTSSGWAADGAHRVMEVQDGEGTLKVVRLRTSLV